MRRLVALSMMMAMAAAMPLMAGEGHKCKYATQECLDHMAKELKHRGWVGIEYNGETMEVTGVIPDSPAEAAGFRAGDVMVAHGGVEIAEASKEDIKKLQEKMVPGAQTKYTVVRDGERVELEVTLAELPESVLAQWIGHHMIKGHAQVQVASAK
jgi:predicted metalloprotease with PDZ domain